MPGPDRLDLEPIPDRSPAAWFAERLRDWRGPSLVGDWMPAGFERYAQFPHAYGSFQSRVRIRGLESLVSHLATILPQFTSTPDTSWYCVWNGFGGLELVEERAIEITPRISMSGRRYLLFRLPVRAAPDLRIRTVTHPLVAYRPRFLRWFVRPPTRIELAWYGPNFWWPEDRAWFVSTEVDGESTYLGGSGALIDRVMSDPRLEVAPARLEDRLE